MRRRRHRLCPLAWRIRKVLPCLSDGASNIDLNNLTRLIPDGSTFSPPPLNSSSQASFSRCVRSRAGSLHGLPTGLPPVQINPTAGWEEKEDSLYSLIIQLHDKQQVWFGLLNPNLPWTHPRSPPSPPEGGLEGGYEGPTVFTEVK